MITTEGAIIVGVLTGLVCWMFGFISGIWLMRK